MEIDTQLRSIASQNVDHVIMQPTNQNVKLVTSIPGPLSVAMRTREEKHLAPGLQGFALMAGISVDHARGSSITDVDGNILLDVIGGIGVNGLGHSHPKFINAITEQVQKASVGSFTSEARVKLFEKMAEFAPTKDLHRLQLYSSGAEAVESALRLAKCYTGKYEFVSFSGGFHGKTMGALSLMGSDFKTGMGPMVPGSHIAPYADCYHCPLNLRYPSCGIACVDLVRDQIKSSSAGSIAAFIVEPMQGTAGNVIPPPEFLQAIASIAKEMGALLIADEMITGFGRTGKTWGIDHAQIEPDIITLGKQFGGGFPISGLLSRDEIVNAKPWSNPSGSSSSYGGNPLAAAASLAALEIIQNEKLVENSATVGDYFLKKLSALCEDAPFVGEVRGRGMFLAVELVTDKKSKTQFSKASCGRLFQEFLKRGLLTMAYAPRWRIQPAMTLDQQTADNVLAIIDDVFKSMRQDQWWK